MSAAHAIGRDAEPRARRSTRRVVAGLLFAAGHLVFLGAHAWPAMTGGLRAVLVGAALLLVTGSVYTMHRAYTPMPTPEVPTLPAAVVAPDLAVAFIARLYALGPAGWTLVAAHAGDHAGARAGARAVLSLVLTELDLDAAERRLEDAIAAVLRGPGVAGLPHAPRVIARSAALSAALAVLVRPWLPARDFEVLYAPFARLIPVTTLRDRSDGVTRFRG